MDAKPLTTLTMERMHNLIHQEGIVFANSFTNIPHQKITNNNYPRDLLDYFRTHADFSTCMTKKHMALLQTVIPLLTHTTGVLQLALTSDFHSWRDQPEFGQTLDALSRIAPNITIHLAIIHDANILSHNDQCIIEDIFSHIDSMRALILVSECQQTWWLDLITKKTNLRSLIFDVGDSVKETVLEELLHKNVSQYKGLGIPQLCGDVREETLTNLGKTLTNVRELYIQDTESSTLMANIRGLKYLTLRHCPTDHPPELTIKNPLHWLKIAKLYGVSCRLNDLSLVCPNIEGLKLKTCHLEIDSNNCTPTRLKLSDLQIGQCRTSSEQPYIRTITWNGIRKIKLNDWTSYYVKIEATEWQHYPSFLLGCCLELSGVRCRRFRIYSSEIRRIILMLKKFLYNEPMSIIL